MVSLDAARIFRVHVSQCDDRVRPAVLEMDGPFRDGFGPGRVVAIKNDIEFILMSASLIARRSLHAAKPSCPTNPRSLMLVVRSSQVKRPRNPFLRTFPDPSRSPWGMLRLGGHGRH